MVSSIFFPSSRLPVRIAFTSLKEREGSESWPFIAIALYSFYYVAFFLSLFINTCEFELWIILLFLKNQLNDENCLAFVLCLNLSGGGDIFTKMHEAKQHCTNLALKRKGCRVRRKEISVKKDYIGIIP